MRERHGWIVHLALQFFFCKDTTTTSEILCSFGAADVDQTKKHLKYPAWRNAETINLEMLGDVHLCSPSNKHQVTINCQICRICQVLLRAPPKRHVRIQACQLCEARLVSRAATEIAGTWPGTCYPVWILSVV